MLTTARIKDELIQEGTPHQSKEEKLSSSLPSMTLLHRLAQNEVPWRTRLLWLQQIAMALSHLHGQSQIHGSLTGDHIRILDNETVELVPASPMIRRTTGVLNYLAPEYFTTSTAQTKTAAMDVYGFAMIMFLICTGKEPWFRFFPNSQPQLIYAVASSKRPSLPKNSQPPEGYVALMKIVR